MTWTSRMSSGSELGPRLMAPSELSLQLEMGHAIEVVYLLRGHAHTDEEDFESLRKAAATMRSVKVTSVTSVGLSLHKAGHLADVPTLPHHSFATAANPAASFELLRAARQAFDNNDLQEVADQLVALGDMLDALADNKVDGLDLDALLDSLRRIHNVLLARTAVAPDEVLGLASL